MNLTMRKGSIDDEDWLYQLFRSTLQNYIDEAWGWDELLQREGFVTTLPAKQFEILLVDEQPIASYHISCKENYFVLDMILVEPAQQGKGHGRRMLDKIKDLCREQNKPIELSVLKSNPALSFHTHCGFREVENDEHSVKMRWTPCSK